MYGPQDWFNLHSYWDTHIVNLAMRNDDVPTFASRLVAELPVAPEWTDTGDPDSMAGTMAQRRPRLCPGRPSGHPDLTYLGPDEASRIPHRWRIQQPAGYDDRSRARIRIQLAKGGYRLAALRFKADVKP